MTSDLDHSLGNAWVSNLNVAAATVDYNVGAALEAEGNLGAAEAAYRHAAQAGHTGAAIALGRLVLLRDPDEAIGWWTRACEGGDLMGACFIGGVYEWASEDGREGALEEAERYYRLALASEDSDTRSEANNGLWRLALQIAASAAAPEQQSLSADPSDRAPNSSDAMRWFAIYDHPSDYPQGFVVREWLSAGGGAIRPGEAWMVPTLEGAHDLIPSGGKCLPRAANDEPQLVETWMVA